MLTPIPLYRKYPTRIYANDTQVKSNIKNPAIVITSETSWRAERFFALAVNISIFIR
jgi:hypothetical protein